MTQLSVSLEQSAPPDPELATEMGWGEVAKGMSRLLVGNLVLIFLPLFGVLLLAVATQLTLRAARPRSHVEVES